MLFWHFTEGAEENHRSYQVNRSLNRDLNPRTAGYEAGDLPQVSHMSAALSCKSRIPLVQSYASVSPPESLELKHINQSINQSIRRHV